MATLTRTMTYAELSEAIIAGTLNKGESITISDYRTVHTIPNTTDTNIGDLEPLLVTAISNNELKPEAYSVLFPDDIIYYCPTNDQTKVTGCTKGYIYRRIDTKQANDFPFDFRQVKFRRWQVSVTTQDTTGATSNYTKGNLVKKTATNELYVKIDDKPAVGFTDVNSWRLFEWRNLDYISPVQTEWYIIDDSYQLVIPTSALYNDYKMWAVSTNYDSAFSNTIDMSPVNLIESNNTVIFGVNFSNNSIGTGFYNNSIGGHFNNNSIGMGFSNNSIGAFVNSNIVDAEFNSNSIGDNFSSNSIGASFSSNIIGVGFNSNIIGVGFNNNSIGAFFNNNSIGVFFNNNIIGVGFNSNIIGVSFNYNTIGANFYSNSIEAGFNNNSIGANFYNNSIGVSFYDNFVGANFNFNNVLPNLMSTDLTSTAELYNKSYPHTLAKTVSSGIVITWYNSTGVLESLFVG